MLQRVYLLLTFALIASVAYPQCTGSVGSPIVNETFGSGASQFGPPLPAGTTNMQYIANTCPEDGYYTLVHSETGCYGAWTTVNDHTGDTNGYYMLINASYQPSDFFVQTVNGLCDGTTYEFAAYIANMYLTNGAIAPDITFTIEKTDGTVLSSYDTGNIPISVTDPATWVKYGLYFTTPVGVSTVVLRMHNNAPGGIGNDLALDDITFSPAGPKTTIGLNGSAADTLNFTCVYGSANFVATVANCYLNNAFQWQTSADTINWANIPGAISSGYNFTPSSPGTYYFRVNVANQGNIGNTNCSINSNTFTVNYSVPAVHNISAAICPGQYYTLPSGKTVNTAGMHYDSLLNRQGCDSITTILNLTISANSSASIAVAICRGQAYSGHTTAGTYLDTLQAANGCDSLVTVTLMVNPNFDLGPDKNLCAGDSIILNPGTFSQYLWQDGSTLPYYKVKSGGLYSVTVTDENGCMGSDSVSIKEIDCSLSNIPNTFTPNGDGINDTWEIDALQAFPNCTVAIYSRWGQQVFKSNGYAKPFDGNYNGRELPVGTYYYVISLSNNSPPVAGFVTIIR